jgi:hypothetical protein
MRKRHETIAALLASSLFAALLTGCTVTAPEKSACALGPDENATKVDLAAADCGRVQAAFTAALDAQSRAAAEAATAAQAQRAESVRRYKAAIAARTTRDEQSGYRATSLEAFQLYGRELAGNHAKVAVEGVYLRTGQGEFLLPSTVAAALIDRAGRADQGVVLLSADADRSAKQFFARCRANVVGAQLGCDATILGHATLCERVTVVGRAEVPCLVVESSWTIAPPAG